MRLTADGVVVIEQLVDANQDDVVLAHSQADAAVFLPLRQRRNRVVPEGHCSVSFREHLDRSFTEQLPGWQHLCHAFDLSTLHWTPTNSPIAPINSPIIHPLDTHQCCLIGHPPMWTAVAASQRPGGWTPTKGTVGHSSTGAVGHSWDDPSGHPPSLLSRSLPCRNLPDWIPATDWTPNTEPR